MPYKLPNANAYENVIKMQQPVQNTNIKQKLESTTLKQNLNAQRGKIMTPQEQEQFLASCMGNTMFNEDYQMLLNNLRVLEVIQRQTFINPTLQNQLQGQRTAYYNAIWQQIKSLNLTVDNLKQILGQLDLQKQLKYAIEYIVSSSDRSTTNSNKLSKLQLYFNSFLNAITSDSTENCHLKQALKELLEIIEEIQGQEGCMPLNWEGTKQLKELYNEISDRCQTNPTLVESYQHWQDRLSSLYYNQLIERRWL